MLSCSYIKPQPIVIVVFVLLGCMLSCSYIKPQPLISLINNLKVVCYHVPTSNHNIIFIEYSTTPLYVIMFLHQTTTHSRLYCIYVSCMLSCSYIKPQPAGAALDGVSGCMLSCSYIKPQPIRPMSESGMVVCYHVPTSNHNWFVQWTLLV